MRRRPASMSRLRFEQDRLDGSEHFDERRDLTPDRRDALEEQDRRLRLGREEIIVDERGERKPRWVIDEERQRKRQYALYKSGGLHQGQWDWPDDRHEWPEEDEP